MILHSIASLQNMSIFLMRNLWAESKENLTYPANLDLTKGLKWLCAGTMIE